MNPNQSNSDQNPTNQIEKTELIKFLLTERDYHSNHPSETSTRFWYTLGATLTTIIAGLVFKDKIDLLNVFVNSNLSLFYISITSIFLGYMFLILALNEHTKIHKLQCERIEAAIDYLLDCENKYSFQDFWTKFGKTHFSINLKTDKKVFLFTKEPDTRKGLRFHNAKIGIGSFFIVLGVVIIVYGVIFNGINVPK